MLSKHIITQHDETDSDQMSWRDLPEELKLLIMEFCIPSHVCVTPTSHTFLFRSHLRTLLTISKDFYHPALLVYNSESQKSWTLSDIQTLPFDSAIRAHYSATKSRVLR